MSSSTFFLHGHVEAHNFFNLIFLYTMSTYFSSSVKTQCSRNAQTPVFLKQSGLLFVRCISKYRTYNNRPTMSGLDKHHCTLNTSWVQTALQWRMGGERVVSSRRIYPFPDEYLKKSDCEPSYFALPASSFMVVTNKKINKIVITIY